MHFDEFLVDGCSRLLKPDKNQAGVADQYLRSLETHEASAVFQSRLCRRISVIPRRTAQNCNHVVECHSNSNPVIAFPINILGMAKDDEPTPAAFNTTIRATKIPIAPFFIAILLERCKPER